MKLYDSAQCDCNHIKCDCKESDFSLVMWVDIRDALYLMYTTDGYRNMIKEISQNIHIPIMNICEDRILSHIGRYIHVAGMTGIPPFTRNGS